MSRAGCLFILLFATLYAAALGFTLWEAAQPAVATFTPSL